MPVGMLKLLYSLYSSAWGEIVPRGDSALKNLLLLPCFDDGMLCSNEFWLKDS